MKNNSPSVCRLWFAILCLVSPTFTFADDLKPAGLKTPFELGDGWQTAEYEQGIQFYRSLADASPRVRMEQAGSTDSGRPLHLVLISGDQDFHVESNRKKQRAVLLVNNAIHPGESDGVDASMAFVRDLVFEQNNQPLLENVLVAVIPFYNIGGTLNRNSTTRVNQNGPKAYGFRGNARNYDLNRDFIKCDTLNARSFAKIFRRLDPDLLIDTHVSNGADYQYVMTTAHSQKDKLGGKLGVFLDEQFEPLLFAQMRQSGFPTVPYVNSGGRPPELGFAQYLETPRYSTGYAALFQTLGFMSETHMLKPYPQRVAATRAFLQESLKLLSEKKNVIRKTRLDDRKNYPHKKRAAIAWELNKEKKSQILFQGYEARYESSNVTSGERLLYDRGKPYSKEIDYYNHYQPSRQIELSAGYLIPGGWHDVIDLMKIHGVEIRVVKEPKQVKAEIYRIEEYSSSSHPYEGHYFHNDVKVAAESQLITAQPGDIVIPIDQPKARYVVETLEPEASDSLFRWNFFDSILQRKESFSSYVFEETASRLLKEDASLKESFEEQKKKDTTFSLNRKQQLEFIYRHSKHYERSHLNYPIARLRELP